MHVAKMVLVLGEWSGDGVDLFEVFRKGLVCIGS